MLLLAVAASTGDLNIGNGLSFFYYSGLNLSLLRNSSVDEVGENTASLNISPVSSFKLNTNSGFPAAKGSLVS